MLKSAQSKIKCFTEKGSWQGWGGRVVRRCWVNFQCRGVLPIWMIVGQGPIALAVGAGGGCLDIFSLIYHFSFLSPSLWETARYRLKYCFKGPLSPKQPTNQKSWQGIQKGQSPPFSKNERVIKVWPILSRAKVTSSLLSIL